MDPTTAFGVTVVLLFLKMFAVAMVQGIARVRNRAFVNPEDAAFFGSGVEPRSEELAIVARAQRTLRNDVENIPIAMLLALAWIQLGCWPEGLAWVLAVFTASRYLHSFFYLIPRQPFRNLSYSTGLVCCFVMAGFILREVVARP